MRKGKNKTLGVSSDARPVNGLVRPERFAWESLLVNAERQQK